MNIDSHIAEALDGLVDDAIDDVQNAAHYATWLAALMAAIRDGLAGGAAVPEVRMSRAKDLAGLGQYLADELAGNMETRALELQSRQRRIVDQE